MEFGSGKCKDISVGDFDKVTDGKQMYDNIDVKFPVKKVPVNNEIFAKNTKCKRNMTKRQSGPRKYKKGKRWANSLPNQRAKKREDGKSIQWGV